MLRIRIATAAFWAVGLAWNTLAADPSTHQTTP